MALDTLVVFAASYDNQDDAIADYDAVHDYYHSAGLIDTYDAAVISRHEDGKIKVVKKHEQPTRQGAWAGLGVGLVGGALVALFPAIALAGGVVGRRRGRRRAGCDRRTRRRRNEPLGSEGSR
jgi:uncharacterized membrane protein